jgi:uncharacterized membrane protein YjjP (DUF1212 family)
MMKVEALVITSPDQPGQANAATAVRPLQELLRFGSLMLSAGETAFRVRRSMGVIASGLGFEWLSVQLGARNLVASACRNGETATLVRDVEIPSVNTERIGALEGLARNVSDMSSSAFAAKLAAIESVRPRYSIVQTAGAVAVACGAFAFLNGGVWPEVAACAIGGGIGQGVRSFLNRRHFNQYAVTALTALVASGVYWVASAVGNPCWLRRRPQQCRTHIVGAIPGARFSTRNRLARPVTARDRCCNLATRICHDVLAYCGGGSVCRDRSGRVFH